MPQTEKFWNPYRWVQARDQPVQRATPNYHHRFSGLSGRIWCELEALTPLLVGDGHGNFLRRRADNKYYVPATSLKGVVRSLAELIGNAAVPFDKCDVDKDHAAQQATHGDGPTWQLDAVARTFGFLQGNKVFAGLVRFSDARIVEGTLPGGKLKEFKVAGGQPDPGHGPFYPDRAGRKLYHHQYGAAGLTLPHAGIKEGQKRPVHPLPSGVTFRFTVDFVNLRDEELGLLLYCLVLEDEVTVTLGKEALGPAAQAAVTFKGPMRHKLGGCKPQGAGSSHIRITKLLLRADAAARYRGPAIERQLADADLRAELARRTAGFRDRNDDTMQQLRAMLVYSPDDPRSNVDYPTYDWFKHDGRGIPLKPTV